MSLRLVALAEVCDVIAGQHIPAAEHNGSGRGTPYITGPADFGATTPTISKWTDSPRQFARASDVLVTVKGAGVGKINFALDAAIGRQVMALRPKPGLLDRRYLFCWMKQNEAKLNQLAQGATIPGVGKPDIEGLRIPLASLPEQRRIADILDKADSIRRKRREAIALTEELLRSAFLEMFGDPVGNPRGWPVRELREAIGSLDAGWSANGEGRPARAGEIGVLKISAVTSGWFRPEENKAVLGGTDRRGLLTPRRGDLLFSRANTRELVGATCLVERDEPGVFLPDKLWRITPSPKATAPYLRFLLSHDRVRDSLTSTATGTSGSMLNVSMEKLRSLRVPLPTPSVQERFGSLVWQTLATRSAFAHAQAGAEALASSLINRCFAGEPR